MQEQFKASANKRTQRYCQTEIRKAIKKNVPILFVEYDSCGDTEPSLTSIVEASKYKKAYTITKCSDDGSNDILKFMRKNKIPRSDFRICGVNTDCCVRDTVDGLDARIGKAFAINVVAKACNSEHSHRLGLDEMVDLSDRVRVV